MDPGGEWYLVMSYHQNLGIHQYFNGLKYRELFYLNAVVLWLPEKFVDLYTVFFFLGLELKKTFTM